MVSFQWSVKQNIFVKCVDFLFEMDLSWLKEVEPKILDIFAAFSSAEVEFFA